jgi:hypothetical protein
MDVRKVVLLSAVISTIAAIGGFFLWGYYKDKTTEAVYYDVDFSSHLASLKRLGEAIHGKVVFPLTDPPFQEISFNFYEDKVPCVLLKDTKGTKEFRCFRVLYLRSAYDFAKREDRKAAAKAAALTAIGVNKLLTEGIKRGKPADAVVKEVEAYLKNDSPLAKLSRRVAFSGKFVESRETYHYNSSTPNEIVSYTIVKDRVVPLKYNLLEEK